MLINALLIHQAGLKAHLDELRRSNRPLASTSTASDKPPSVQIR